VLIAEDHAIVRQGTRLLLESAGIQVIGEAVDGVQAVQLARELRPDVVLMDIHLPQLTGIEATRRIRHELPQVRVLVLTAYDDPVYVAALLSAGADGFILKTANRQQLLTALHEVAAGSQAFPPLAERGAPEGCPLTEREREILQHAARGLTNKQIGAALFISDRTVQGHLQNIYQKLNVVTRTEAVTTAITRGWIVVEGRP
jgi:DNA-binding NarL/FixJ family response regulator